MFFPILFCLGAAVIAEDTDPVHHISRRSYEDDSGFSFILDLYDRLSSENIDGNVLLSPFSVASVLALTLEGARGKTATQMQKVLHWNALDDPGVRESIRDALTKLNRATGGYVLTVANHVYLQDGFDVLDSYRTNLHDFHLSEVDNLDFGQEDNAREVINSWVSKATNGRIQELMGPGGLDKQTRLLLLNAVYFKGDWATKFDERGTQPRPFFPMKSVQEDDKATEIRVPMMFTKGEYLYSQLDNLNCSLLELPYRGSQLAMYILLPDAPDGLDKLRGSLWNHPNIFYSPESLLSKQNVTVLLPKFRLEEDSKLKNVLANMGMRDLFFQGKADLSGIAGSKDLYVSDVVHKAFMEVNEKGTKAAAVSAVTIRGRMMRFDPIFRADHPFMFFIQDKMTKTVLFIGHVKQLPDMATENTS